jgi:DNA helicase-2/ATP-dependent DNA helicase PcrA
MYYIILHIFIYPLRFFFISVIQRQLFSWDYMKTYRILNASSGAAVDYPSALNPQQLEVVMAGEGAILVIAGAGTGKTRTLVFRVARLLERGVPPDEIMLCTFTNKAAREMLKRVEELIGSQARQVLGGTFHHVANRILRDYADRIGYESSYSILDEEDSQDLLATCQAEYKPRGDRFLPRPAAIIEPISFAINTLQPLDQVILHHSPELLPFLDDIVALARDFRDRKRKCNAMDFDDLLLNLKILLEDQNDVLKDISGKLEHTLVDEYQDTNALQCAIVDLFARQNGNLTVVGDDAQSIYSFRGADPNNILRFIERWPDAMLFKLEQNYRSSPQILALANNAIRHNRQQVPKELFGNQPNGPLPALIPVPDNDTQAAFVAQRVIELAEEGISLDTMAVLYRAHHHSLELQVELTRRKIPYLVRSGVRFFEQAHIKDVLAYLRIFENSHDELSWMRVLKLQPGIGRQLASRIFDELKQDSNPLEYLVKRFGVEKIPKRGRDAIQKLISFFTTYLDKETDTPGRVIQAVLDQGYRELLTGMYANPKVRADDLERLADYADRFDSIQSFLSELHLLASFGTEEVVGSKELDEHLILSSIHQAKGLEWKVVYIIGLNEGGFPHPRALLDAGGEAEERRLFYVALTRAKEELYLVYPMAVDRSGGRRVLLRPSRFLEEVSSNEYVERWSVNIA